MFKIWGEFIKSMGAIGWFFLSGFLYLVAILYFFKWIIKIFNL